MHWGEQAIWALSEVARRLTSYRLLLTNPMHDEVTDCVNGIRFDTHSASTSGFASGLKRIVDLMDLLRSSGLEFMSHAQCQVRARAYKQMGIPPCFTIHNSIECHCCCVEL